MSAPRGFTLIELVVALGLALGAAGLVARQLLQSRRLARALAERIAVQENVRAAALVFTGELGDLGYDESAPEPGSPPGERIARSDLLATAPGAVTYLVGRGGGHVCGVVIGPATAILVPEATWSSSRAPRDTDSLLVFVERDPATGADDGWVHLGIRSLGTASCSDGAPALALRIGVPAGLSPAAFAGITAGSPVQVAEVMEIRYYTSGGRSWLGMRSVSTGEAISPVAGPLADSSAGVRGLTVRYLDAGGAPASSARAVRAVEIALVGVTDAPVYRRDLRRAAMDSFALTVAVTPRNSPVP